MNFKIDTPIKSLSTTLVAIVALIGALWFFGKAPFNEKVDERIELFLQSPAMVVFVSDIREAYELKEAKDNSGVIKLRKLLSIKMGVDEDEVHIELGKLYKNEIIFKEYIQKEFTDVKKNISNNTLTNN